MRNPLPKHPYGNKRKFVFVDFLSKPPPDPNMHPVSQLEPLLIEQEVPLTATFRIATLQCHIHISERSTHRLNPQIFAKILESFVDDERPVTYQRVAQHHAIFNAIRDLDANRGNFPGKMRGYNFYLSRPCQTCANALVKIYSGWAEVKNLLWRHRENPELFNNFCLETDLQIHNFQEPSAALDYHPLVLDPCRIEARCKNAPFICQPCQHHILKSVATNMHDIKRSYYWPRILTL